MCYLAQVPLFLWAQLCRYYYMSPPEVPAVTSSAHPPVKSRKNPKISVRIIARPSHKAFAREQAQIANVYKDNTAENKVSTQEISRRAILQTVPSKEVVEYNLDYTWRHSESTFVRPPEERDSLVKFSRSDPLVEARKSS